MADSRSDCISVFCLCTTFTEFRTLLPASTWGPGWSVTNSVLTRKFTEGVPGPSVGTLNMGIKTEDRTLVNRLLSHCSLSCLYLLFFFCSWLMKPDVTAIFTPSCNLKFFFIHWFAAPASNDKRLFSTETLLCKSWKNTAFSHLAPAKKWKPGCNMIWRL